MILYLQKNNKKITKEKTWQQDKSKETFCQTNSRINQSYIDERKQHESKETFCQTNSRTNQSYINDRVWA